MQKIANVKFKIYELSSSYIALRKIEKLGKFKISVGVNQYRGSIVRKEKCQIDINCKRPFLLAPGNTECEIFRHHSGTEKEILETFQKDLNDIVVLFPKKRYIYIIKKNK